MINSLTFWDGAAAFLRIEKPEYTRGGKWAKKDGLEKYNWSPHFQREKFSPPFSIRRYTQGRQKQSHSWNGEREILYMEISLFPLSFVWLFFARRTVILWRSQGGRRDMRAENKHRWNTVFKRFGLVLFSIFKPWRSTKFYLAKTFLYTVVF